MTDREKLIQIIDSSRTYVADKENLANDLIANGVTVQEWIPVSKRMPEPEVDVLVFCHGCVEFLAYRYNKRGHACFMYRDDSGYWKEVFTEVTHWMPLPNPPQEDN